MSNAAVVVIGRNEGERLARCLDSVMALGRVTVYVDSGSADGSLRVAKGKGVVVVELDPARPFSAARARNEGFELALSLAPGMPFVQFVDGDCVLDQDWLDHGEEALRSDPGLAAVSGRLREVERDRSIYNRLCDLEWDVPAGDAQSCGGIALFRASAFQESGGFLPDLIAGEEPELCLRLRRRGWRIARLPRDMARHDAGMTRLAQWWRRAMRGGWAYAAGVWLHGMSGERFRVRENASVLLFGVLLPIATAALTGLYGGTALVLLGAYPLLALRIYLRSVRRGRPRRDAALQASFTVIAKFAEAIGQARFVAQRATGKRPLVSEMDKHRARV